MDSQLGVQLGDAPFRRSQFGLLLANQAVFQATVDARLALLGADRLITDAEVTRYIRDPCGPPDQIQHLRSELG